MVYFVSDGDNPRPSSGKKRLGAYEPGGAGRDGRLSDQGAGFRIVAVAFGRTMRKRLHHSKIVR